MRIPFEPDHQSDEQEESRKMLAGMLRAMLASRHAELLNISLLHLVGRVVFGDITRFDKTGCMVTFNEAKDEMMLTVYLNTGDKASAGVWWRHFGVRFCEEHGLHLTELMPPFLVDDMPEDVTIDIAHVSGRQRDANLN